MMLSVCMVGMSVLSAAPVVQGAQGAGMSACPEDGGLAASARAPYRKGLAALEASRWTEARAWLDPAAVWLPPLVAGLVGVIVGYTLRVVMNRVLGTLFRGFNRGFDAATGRTVIHDFGRRLVGEAAFVPRPGQSGRTRAVRGEMGWREALARMTDGTPAAALHRSLRTEACSAGSSPCNPSQVLSFCPNSFAHLPSCLGPPVLASPSR